MTLVQNIRKETPNNKHPETKGGIRNPEQLFLASPLWMKPSSKAEGFPAGLIFSSNLVSEHGRSFCFSPKIKHLSLRPQKSPLWNMFFLMFCSRRMRLFWLKEEIWEIDLACFCVEISYGFPLYCMPWEQLAGFLTLLVDLAIDMSNTEKQNMMQQRYANASTCPNHSCVCDMCIL